MSKPKGYFQWQSVRLRKRLISAVSSKLYRDRDRDIRRSIMVAGTARSGTTWLASLITSQIPCRLMFEPFHSRKVPAFSQFHYFQYMRPHEQNDALLSYCQNVFTGEIRQSWIDRQVEYIYPKYRLVKEIRANLFLKWIHIRFPEIPLLFIIRHPCAVVASRIRLSWATDTDIKPFLSQTLLVDDFLADKMDVIRRAQSVEEQHAVIWCISNLVPIKQFHNSKLSIIFYENLCIQPEVEISKIFQTINQEFNNSVFKYIDTPSLTTTNKSAIIKNNDKITYWEKILTTKQINNILSVVNDFGLSYLYDDPYTPCVQTL